MEILDEKDVSSPAGLAKWLKYLYKQRGVEFSSPASSAKRIRLVMLETWRSERQHCTGYNRLHLLPPLGHFNNVQ